MKITEVRVYPVRKSDDKLKAFATITFDDCFVVRDLKVINGNTGYFIAMPSRKRNDGTYSDVAHPLNSEMRNYIEEVVLGEYRRIVDSGEFQPDESSSDETPEPEATRSEMEGSA
jgi:stage V sporulation protein G